MKVRHVLLTTLVAFAAGCRAKHKPPEPSLPDPAEVDARIAEALENADPILRYKRVPLPDEENAFPLWKEAAGKRVRAGEDLREALSKALDEYEPFPEGDDGRRLSEWMEKNAEALALFDAGIARGRCQFPEIEGRDVDIPYLAPLRAAGRLKLVKAKLLAQNGNLDAAAGEITGIIRLGEMIAGGEGPLIHYLVAIAVQGYGTRGARWLARQEGVSAPALDRMIRSLENAARPGDKFAAAMRVAFTCCAAPVLRELDDVLAKFFEHGLPQPFGEPIDQETADMIKPIFTDPRLFDRADTLRLIGRLYAQVACDARSPWIERDTGRKAYWERFHKAATEDFVTIFTALVERVKKNEDLSDEDLRELVGPVKNPFGRLVTGLLVAADYAALDRCFRTLADRETTKTVLALRLYELRHGELPADLNALVTDGILAEIAADPCSSERLRYDRTRRIIWSVGENGKDDGGDATDERGKPAWNWWDGRDSVWELPAAR